MSKPTIARGHSFTLRDPQSLPYGERHLWEATISWEGERPDLNTAKVRVRRDGFTNFSGTLLGWNQACAVVEEATKACFEEAE